MAARGEKFAHSNASYPITHVQTTERIAFCGAQDLEGGDWEPVDAVLLGVPGAGLRPGPSVERWRQLWPQHDVLVRIEDAAWIHTLPQLHWQAMK